MRWDPDSNTLSGTANVIGGEAFEIVIANNGTIVLEPSADGAQAKLEAHAAAGLSRLTLTAAKNTIVIWELRGK